MAGKVGNPNFKKGMKPLNPAGRPKGSKNAKTSMQNALIESFSTTVKKDFDKIVKKLVSQALEGDISASKLILDRVVPARKAVEHMSTDGQAPVNIIIGSLVPNTPEQLSTENDTAIIEHSIVDNEE